MAVRLGKLQLEAAKVLKSLGKLRLEVLLVLLEPDSGYLNQQNLAIKNVHKKLPTVVSLIEICGPKLDE